MQTNPWILKTCVHQGTARAKVFGKTTIHWRRFTCCSPHRIWKKLDISTLSTCKQRPCCPCNLSIEKYCERSNQGGLFNGDFGWLVVCLQTDFVSGKYRLLFASAVTYLPYQTFSRLVTGNSYKNICRLYFKNNLDLEAVFRKIFMFRYWSMLSLFSLSDA